MRALGLALCMVLSIASGATGAPRDHGPALRANYIHAAIPVGADRFVAVTSGVLDQGGARIFDYDIRANTIRRIAPLPSGGGAWAIARDATNVYVGTYRPSQVWRYGLDEGGVELLADFPDVPFIWDIALDGSTLFVGGGGGPKGPLLVALDVQTGAQTAYAGLSDSGYVRTLSFSGETLFAGLGPRARLVAIDRKTASAKPILPERYRDQSGVYWSHLSGNTLYFSLSPSHTILSYDVGSGTFRTEIADATAKDWQRIEHPASVLRGHGDFLYEIGEDGRMARVGLPPVPLSGAFIHDGGIAAFTRNGRFVRYSLNGELRETRSLAEAGLEPIPLIAAAMAVHDGTVYVASREMRAFTPAHGTETYHLVSGEPKAMCVRDGHLHSAHYTGAALWRFPLEALHSAEAELSADAWRVWAVGRGQNRPMAIVCADGYVAFGGEPDYGTYGGALIVQFDTGDRLLLSELTRGHNVQALAARGREVVIGTAALGGTGAKPRDEAARIIKYDLDRRTVVFDIPADDRIVRGVALLGDSVFAVLDGGGLMSIDATDGAIKSRTPSSAGFLTILATHDGRLIGAARSSIVEIDPRTLATRMLARAGRPRLVTEDAVTGTLWWLERDTLKSLPRP